MSVAKKKNPLSPTIAASAHHASSDGNSRPLWRPPQPTDNTRKRLETAVIELNRRLSEILSTHQRPVFSTSLVAEDMVLFDAIYRGGHRIRTFTLNTGKLPVQTLTLLTRAQNTYQSLIEEIHPQQEDLVRFFDQYSDFSEIYQKPQARLSCCDMRMVKPMMRILGESDAWITGRRRGQSKNRADLRYREKDATHNLIKYNPIYDWDEELVWAYALSLDVPVNELHYFGYPSIGCETCTRAVRQGDDSRSGRWWWESSMIKESGMHEK